MGPRAPRAALQLNRASSRRTSRWQQATNRKQGYFAMMRQDRFTEQAQEVLQASQELVRNHRHAQWDVEHVLLALLQHPNSFAKQVVAKLGVDANVIQHKVADALGKAPKLGYD